ncbi:YybH family protein [Reyranella sp.]|uniref:YybH family protein n=1 Tax=Reyranella sp. TaxID=1929291 RepID=UPI003D0D854B
MKALLTSFGLLLAAVSAPASGQPVDAEAAIRAALGQWTSAFNARDPSRICDLFAKDLRYDFRGLPERDYDTLCGLLHKALADRSKQLVYSHDIREIIVSGDLAVVRLIWTVKMMVPGATNVVETKEPGLDVFRRQLDGSWKIIRYIAYEAP